MCNPLARYVVQLAGPPSYAACRPALLCSLPAYGKFIFFIWQHGLPFSVIPVTEFDI